MKLSLKKNNLLNIVAFLFLTNGVYYFFNPTEVHAISFYKYTKYIILGLFVLLTFRDKLKKKILYLLFLVPFILYYFLVNSEANFIIFFNYTLPFYLFLSVRSLSLISWKKIILLVILVSYIFGFYEILFLDNHFYMYNRSLNDYRVVSIFLNPNNHGVVIALLSYVALVFFEMRLLFKIAIYILTFIMVKFSGSKTALVIYLLYTFYFLYIFFRHNYKTIYHFLNNKWALLSMSLIFIFIIRKVFQFQSSYNTREFDLDSLYIRLSDYFNFFNSNYGNIMFPWFVKGENIDNIYLHIFGSFGFIVLVAWLFFNLLLLMKVKENSSFFILLVSFLIVGITTNFMYFWPVSYFYWGLAGLIMYNYNIKLNSDDR